MEIHIEKKLILLNNCYLWLYTYLIYSKLTRLSQANLVIISWLRKLYKANMLYFIISSLTTYYSKTAEGKQFI